MKVSIFIILLSVVLQVNTIKFYKSVRRRLYRALPCGKDDTIVSVFQYGLASGYNVTIQKVLEPATNIKLTFDSGAAVFFSNETAIYSDSEQNELENIISINLLKSSNKFTFNVIGHVAPFAPPYLTSLKINGEEFCSHPNMTYFSDFPVGVHSHVDRRCGRRKILHINKLIYKGIPTKYGDWPWHAAIYRRNDTMFPFKYICGGTLISRHFVLTAAHCAKINGQNSSSELFKVHLGKYHLFRSNDVGLQVKEVETVYVHNRYKYSSVTVNNDIALLKLSTEAKYNNYVQPACLWDGAVLDRLAIDALGTVVGWGTDQNDKLLPTLHSVTIPQLSDNDCLFNSTRMKMPFYANALQDSKKFCAGFTNGTSVCNGDSGGGFVQFVPDIVDDTLGLDASSVPGAWYVRGIVSTTVARQDAAICDPTAYTVFTDVAEYLPWIQETLSIVA